MAKKNKTEKIVKEEVVEEVVEAVKLDQAVPVKVKQVVKSPKVKKEDPPQPV